MAHTGVDVWESVIGQEDVTEFLRRTVAEGRWGHAYLFIGPQGVGKTTVALRFAQALLCLEAAGDHKPCGRCGSCHRFAQGTHPDFLSLRPEGKSIGVDAVRRLQHRIAMHPGLSPRRVVLVEPAEAMGDVAQNALLKTLEEPPGDTVLILITHTGEGVLPTLSSRCQRIRFSLVPAPRLRALLEEKRPEYREVSGLVAALADGRPGLVLERDWSQVLARRRALLPVILQWPTADPLPALQLAAAWEGLSDEEQGIELDLIQYWMRDLLVLQECPEAPAEWLVHGDQAEELRRQVQRWPRGRLLEIQESFSRARERLRRHVNRRLNWEVLLLNISQPHRLPIRR